MLKRLLCILFLAVFCFGNTAYAASNETIAKRLESQLRKDLTGRIHETVRQGCRQAGLDIPREISIEVGSYDRKICFIILKLSSYVPEGPVKRIAKSIGYKVADILKGKGWLTEGMLIVVQSCDLGTGANFYDAETLSNEDGYLVEDTIPREDMMKLLNRQK